MTFRAKKGAGDALHLDVRLMLRDLAEWGYALRESAEPFLDDGKNVVSCPVAFTGPDAWKHYVTKPAESAEHWEAVRRRLTSSPKFTPYRTPSRASVPSCRCTGKKGPLILWATPKTGCPPLLCPKDSVIPVYRLGIPAALWCSVLDWDSQTRSCAEAWCAGGASGTPSRELKELAWGHLSDPKGWIAARGASLADELSTTLRRKVTCPIPAASLSRL